MKKSIILVGKLIDAYPGYYTKQSSNPKRFEGLVRLWDKFTSDLTEQQISNGIEKMVCFNEFPSVTKFRRYCLNIIDAEDAWELIDTHPLAKKVWNDINKWDKKTKSEYDLKQLFKSLYRLASEQVLLVKKR